MATLHLATFRLDVTPPPGHPLCGGWIEPVRGVDDPLFLCGAVLLGAEAPIVLAAVDWCGLRNDAHRLWREALARAAHTTPERVALHCVHPHNAPFADVEAQKMLANIPGAPSSLDLRFFESVVKQSAEQLKKSLVNTVRVTHVAQGKARVEQVASNRRLLGDDGKVRFTRTSATTNKEMRDLPEGLIDPWLRTLSFWDGDTARLALHYYATHPMSYYGDGRVSRDFCGLAREKWQAEQRGVPQLYFTGCAGNITAGKYNDGSKTNRAVLRDRIYSALKTAWQNSTRSPLKGISWRVEPLLFKPRREANFSREHSWQVLRDAGASAARRGNAAFQLAWLQRIERPVEISCLSLGSIKILYLPGEPFVEYQLHAQKINPEVVVAGYGDGGMGYIPTDRAFFEGGYEPTVALAAPIQSDLEKTIKKLVS